jgi:phage-related protein
VLFGIAMAFPDLFRGTVFRLIHQFHRLLTTVLTHIDLLRLGFVFIGVIDQSANRFKGNYPSFSIAANPFSVPA